PGIVSRRVLEDTAGVSGAEGLRPPAAVQVRLHPGVDRFLRVGGQLEHRLADDPRLVLEAAPTVAEAEFARMEAARLSREGEGVHPAKGLTDVRFVSPCVHHHGTAHGPRDAPGELETRKTTAGAPAGQARQGGPRPDPNPGPFEADLAQGTSDAEHHPPPPH